MKTLSNNLTGLYINLMNKFVAARTTSPAPRPPRKSAWSSSPSLSSASLSPR